MFRIKPDINGNGRMVISWMSIPSAGSYSEAIKMANSVGGKKFHNKQFGGGIVFQASSEAEVQRLIDAIKKVENAKA